MARQRKTSEAPKATNGHTARIDVPAGGDARAFYATALAAREERLRLQDVEAESIRRLKGLLPQGKSSFSMDGRVYQIRERGGVPYLVAMPLPGEVGKL
jgi:hypothetical protein